jgi:hypothetical protein
MVLHCYDAGLSPTTTEIQRHSCKLNIHWFCCCATIPILIHCLKNRNRDVLRLYAVRARSIRDYNHWSGPSGSPISPVHCTGASNWPIGPSHWPIGGPNTSRASHSLTPIGQLEGLRPPIRQ